MYVIKLVCHVWKPVLVTLIKASEASDLCRGRCEAGIA